MSKFILHSDYKPTGDQPQAIENLVKSLEMGNRHQTLLGVTGSGETFTMANVIKETNRPALVIAQQDAGSPALQRIPGVFPGKCRILCQIRLLPA